MRNRQIARRMPRVDVPDVVLEIMGRAGLANAFTHLSERHAWVEEFSISLGAVRRVDPRELARPDPSRGR